MKTFLPVALFFAFWSSQILAASPAEVGEVIYAKGVATSQKKGEVPRVVGKGIPLYRGDTLNTGNKSFALIKLVDGSRITLRPNTALRLDDINIEPGKENALLSLLKGGLRAVTGFIGKRRPNAYNMNTVVATIGIRGTAFDARLCDKDCDQENKKQHDHIEKIAPAVARIAYINGTVSAIDKDKNKRRLEKGGPIYEGDRVVSQKHSAAVLVFRDRTRVTVRANTTFDVTSYQYDSGKQLQDDKAVGKRSDSVGFDLLKGGLRILTGLIGKRTPEAFKLNTVVATIGIRGTGFDVNASQGCSVAASCDLHTAVWDGEVYMQLPSGIFTVKNGEAMFLEHGRNKPVRLPNIPVFMLDDAAPRPDRIDVDFENLFATVAGDGSRPGLYVTVRDGHVALMQGGKVIDIARDESAYAGKGILQRLRLAPDFIIDDPYPRPDQFDDNVQRIIELISDEVSGLECRI